jgi:anti-sigma regulatory factor (Ser/Thr protein kinase)
VEMSQIRHGTAFDVTGMTGAARNYFEDIPVTQNWPLESSLVLGAYESAVPCSRLHALQVAWEWGFGEEEARRYELLVSELVTNSVRASRELGMFTPVRLWLKSDMDKFLILVWDASTKPPARPLVREENVLSDNGRGLMLVDAMSEEWSWFFPANSGGKVVWALCGREVRTADR